MLQHNKNKEVWVVVWEDRNASLAKKMRFLAVSVFFICCCRSHGVTAADKPIQTFVIPHSHMDVGWVYTIQVGFCPHSLNKVLNLTGISCTVCFITVSSHQLHIMWMNVCVFPPSLHSVNECVCLTGEHARLCSQCVHQCDWGAVKGQGPQVHRRGAGVLSTVVGYRGHRLS